MNRGLVLAGATAMTVLGYTFAVWLARVTAYAERVEEDRYCRSPGTHAATTA